jgi:hypothetical protein
MFDKSAIASYAEIQRKAFDSSDSGESSDDFEHSITKGPDNSEGDLGLIQRLYPTKPSELCFLLCGFFLLTIE